MTITVQVGANSKLKFDPITRMPGRPAVLLSFSEHYNGADFVAIIPLDKVEAVITAIKCSAMAAAVNSTA